MTTGLKILSGLGCYLDTPMLPAEVFVKTVNRIFEGLLIK